MSSFVGVPSHSALEESQVKLDIWKTLVGLISVNPLFKSYTEAKMLIFYIKLSGTNTVVTGRA